MKTLRFSALLGFAALGMTFLTGCGGGGGGSVDRSVLTGGSSKVWSVSLIDANATSFTGTDNDPETFVACPASFSARGGGRAWSCGAGDHITFDEDGTVEWAVGPAGTGGTWSLSGSTLTIVFGGALGTTTDTVQVVNSGRVVLRRVRREVGGVVQTTEAQNAYVIVNP